MKSLVKKGWFFTKCVFLYHSPFKFVYSSRSTLHGGYAYSHSPSLDCLFQKLWPFLPLFPLTAEQEEREEIMHFVSEETKAEGGCEYFTLRRDRKKNPLMCCLWLNYEAAQFLILATYHFSQGQWLLAKNSKSIFAPGKDLIWIPEYHGHM